MRIAFLQNLLAMSDMPSGWELFVAHYLARGTDGDYRFRSKVAELLHIEDSSTQTKWLDANPKRAPHLLLAHAIASIEGEYEYGKSGWKSTRSPAYLLLLSKWGYTLADVEETIANAKKATS